MPKDDPQKAKAARKAELKQIELDEARIDLEQKFIELQQARSVWGEMRQTDRRARFSSREQGIFHLEGMVTRESCQSLIRDIQWWSRYTPKKSLTLQINSPGGSVIDGFGLYDTLRTLSDQGRKVTTVVRGYAASMAGVLFLAGDVRLVGSESFVHVHEPSSMAFGKLSEQKDDIEFTGRLHKKIKGLYVSRTKITEKMFDRRVDRREWWLDSEEAVKLGVATAVG